MLPFKHCELNLKEKEIRLLRLDKTEDEAAPIRLSIRHAVLNRGLEFNALSYAWGDDPPSHNVTICGEDGQEGLFAIRENLNNFFVAARKFHERWTAEWIWIDQICINQNYHEERCHQVAQMTTLYSTAKATIVWPGVMAAISEEPSGSAGLIDLSRYEQDVDNPMYFGLDKSLLENLVHRWLSSLLLQPYWFRLWIVQEVALASDVVIFWTHATYSLDQVHNTLSLVRDWLQDDAAAEINVDDIFDRTLTLQYMRHCIGDSTTWSHIFGLYHKTHCSEPLDRVYAMMGLVDESVRFKPDYSLTRRELLKKVFQVEIAFYQRNAKAIPVNYLVDIVQVVMVDVLDDQREQADMQKGDWNYKTASKRIAVDILTKLEADMQEGDWNTNTPSERIAVDVLTKLRADIGDETSSLV